MFLNFFIPVGAIGIVFFIPDLYAQPTVELTLINSCIMSLVLGFSISSVEFLSRMERKLDHLGQDGKARVVFLKKTYSFLLTVSATAVLGRLLYWAGSHDSMSRIIENVLATNVLFTLISISTYNLLQTRYAFSHRFVWGFLLLGISLTILHFNVISY